MEHTFVVLTPTYQRVNTLPRLYKSLCAQTYQNFCWLIIDDGSTDGTDNLVKSFIKEGKVDIEYHWKENGGKHTAFQESLKYIDEKRYKYVVPADSDDTLTENALSVFLSNWKQIEENGLKIGYIKSRCVRSVNGRQFPYKTPNNKNLDTTYHEVTFVMGDDCEYDSCATVQVFRKYSIAPPKFWLSDRSHFSYFPEGVLWARAGKEVMFRYIPDVTRIYNEDAANSLVRTKTPNYKGLYPRMVAVKYIVPENFPYFLKYQRKKLLKKMVLYVACWYLLPISWKECLHEINNRGMRTMFVLLTPFAPIFSRFVK